MTLCPTKIETRVNCRLLNGFGSGQSSPEHLHRKIVGNLRTSLGNFRKSRPLQGKYLTNLTKKKLAGIRISYQLLYDGSRKFSHFSLVSLTHVFKEMI